MAAFFSVCIARDSSISVVYVIIGIFFADVDIMAVMILLRQPLLQPWSMVFCPLVGSADLPDQKGKSHGCRAMDCSVMFGLQRVRFGLATEM